LPEFVCLGKVSEEIEGLNATRIILANPGGSGYISLKYKHVCYVAALLHDFEALQESVTK